MRSAIAGRGRDCTVALLPIASTSVGEEPFPTDWYVRTVWNTLARARAAASLSLSLSILIFILTTIINVVVILCLDSRWIALIDWAHYTPPPHTGRAGTPH